jgi:transglutaminase-like putative cysteine protease
MIYDIRLRLTHFYSGPVGFGRHRVRVVPLDIPTWQRVLSWTLEGDPVPSEQLDERDFFENHSSFLLHNAPHAQMQIRMAARVERLVQQLKQDTSPTIIGLAAQIASLRDLSPASPHHFLGRSERITMPVDLTRYARTQAASTSSSWAAVQLLGMALHRDMRFDGSATTVDTPLEEAFHHRHGVCQDFAHIMIAGLRSLGIPARYVSGFLRTEPPEGQARLEGADAMHAWVSAWCGARMGWVEYDPTNGIIVGTDHITVGYGRDYFDVSPIKGVLRSSGQSSVAQAVDVIPVVAY